MTYLVTGASGQLGGLALAHLKTLVPADQIIALVRREEAGAALAAQGFGVRVASYDDPAALERAFEGVERLLLISGSEVGQRARQHGNVIAAAKAAGVGFIAYTSLLRADVSPMALAVEHKATEAALAQSGIAHALLRNGWYSENLLASLANDLSMGQHFGAAGAGRFACAPRQDYAQAAAIVLAGGAEHDGKTYELAGDSAVTLEELAEMISAASGKAVSYVDMPQDAYTAALVGAGLPEGFAAILADSDARASEGWLDSDSTDLSRLIGHPSEPMAETVAKAVAEAV